MLDDPKTSSKVEADFRQYYNISIRDLWKDDSDLTVREVCDLLWELPDESRCIKYLRNDVFDIKDHLLANISDTLGLATFNLEILASAKAGKEYRRIIKKAPKPMERPKVYEEEKPTVKEFAKASQLVSHFTKHTLEKMRSGQDIVERG